MTGRFLALAAVGLLGGCSFHPPDFGDTEYQCSAPDFACPPGQTCRDGRCVTPWDAALEEGDVDALPGTPDARPEITVSFGETPDDDVTGVTEDTYVHQDFPLANYGAAEILEVDEQPLRVALLRFDVSAIPADAEVLSATLVVWTADNPFRTGTVAVYRVLEDWREGNQNGLEGAASYTLRLALTPWTAPGVGPGSRDTVLSAEFAANAIETEWRVPLPADLVQGWVTTPTANHGVVVTTRDAETTGGVLHSSESGVASRRPRLLVTLR